LRITPEAEALLSAYDWPGNIRQLENAMFRAVVLAEGSELGCAEFPQIAAQIRGFELPRSAVQLGLGGALRSTEAAPEISEDPLPMPDIAPYVKAPHLQPEPRATEYGMLRLVSTDGQMRRLEDIEAEAIRFAIEIHQGRMSEVARRLGIGRSTLYRKLKEYGLEEPAEEDGMVHAD
jgi:DNA-binding NtrC family response regulator